MIYECRSCGYPHEGKPEACKECGGTSFLGADVDKRILKQNELFKRSTRYLERNAPYYPKYKFIKQADFIGEILHPTESVEFNGMEVYYVTTKVRHKHEGTWYARHHVQSYHIGFESQTSRETVKEKLTQQLINQVYLDLRFGEINPDFETPDGQLLDPVDKLQVSEKERLGL